MSLWPRMQAACASHPQLAKPSPADYVALAEELGVLLVADGTRGGTHGHVAAGIAVDAVRDLFTNPDATWPSDVAEEPAEAREQMLAAFSLANRRVKTRARRHPHLAGMTTAMAAALVLPGAASLCVAHVGELHVFLIRGGQLTRPAGNLTPETLASAIGKTDAVEPDVRIVPLRPADVILVATPSLLHVLADAEITDVAALHPKVADAARALADRARARGADEALTIVLGHWSPGSRSP